LKRPLIGWVCCLAASVLSLAVAAGCTAGSAAHDTRPACECLRAKTLCDAGCHESFPLHQGQLSGNIVCSTQCAKRLRACRRLCSR
jgi:hypothetical protein